MGQQHYSLCDLRAEMGVNEGIVSDIRACQISPLKRYFQGPNNDGSTRQNFVLFAHRRRFALDCCFDGLKANLMKMCRKSF